MTTGAATRSRGALWWAGARPRTLGASIVPVAVGTAIAPDLNWEYAALALCVAVGLQVGVNYANDYFDGMKGVDTAARVGPVRLVGSGLATPRSVAVAAAIAFTVAAVAGATLAVLTDLRLLFLGAAALAAAILYSGGPKPYAGLGLGELFVFVFFGPVAVAGTVYVQSDSVGLSIPKATWWAGAAIGLLAVAILMANNIRDIATDSASGKRTLAVRVGDGAARRAFRLILAGAYLVVVGAVATESFSPWSLIVFASVPLAVRPLRDAGHAQGPAMVRVLLGTAKLHATFGLLLIVSFVITRATGSWPLIP